MGCSINDSHKMNIKEIVDKQLSIDFNCSLEEIQSTKNIFTEYEKKTQRRKFKDTEEMFLKVACFHGKLLVTGKLQIIEWFKSEYEKFDGAWFSEYSNLRKIDLKLNEFGYQISEVHPFYIATDITPISKFSYKIVWYFDSDIEKFRGDKRFEEAFAFDKDAPDKIGVSLLYNEKILGMAGASKDSDLMWQIGINVTESGRGLNVGTILVTLLKNKLLQNNIVPFYGTAMSHIRSQQVAQRSGFIPMWTELSTNNLQLN